MQFVALGTETQRISLFDFEVSVIYHAALQSLKRKWRLLSGGRRLFYGVQKQSL
jgi:hypothetical protein